MECGPSVLVKGDSPVLIRWNGPARAGGPPNAPALTGHSFHQVRGLDVGLKSWFDRRQRGAGAVATPIVESEPVPEQPLTPAQLAELQEAWAEFNEAAKGSGANSVHACTRNGKPWQQDPAAVRSMAALLRHVRDEDTTPGTEPAG